jgi:cytochrome P450
MTIDNLPKSQEAFFKIRPLIGNSFLTMEGEEWYKIRKMFNPAFSPRHLETLVPQMVKETLVLVDKLEKAAEQGSTVKMLDNLTVSSPPQMS